MHVFACKMPITVLYSKTVQNIDRKQLNAHNIYTLKIYFNIFLFSQECLYLLKHYNIGRLIRTSLFSTLL